MRIIFGPLCVVFLLAPVPLSAQPRALTPLTFTDADYPFASLLEAEEGRVGLNLTIGPDGRVTAVQIGQSSGSVRLDVTAAYFAQSRWRFEPGPGRSTSVDVPWTFPLTPADELLIAVPAPRPPGVVPPQPLPVVVPRRPRGFEPAPLAGNPATLPATADDFPQQAIRAAEAGVAGVRFLVKEDGTIGETQLAESSGIRRLDDAALRMVRARWRASPATLAGQPVSLWLSASVSYRPITNAPRPPRCYMRPIIGREAVLITAHQVNESQIENPVADVPLAERWIQVGMDGSISDALLHTAKGWMRLSRPLVEALPAYPSPEQRICWFYDPVPLKR